MSNTHIPKEMVAVCDIILSKSNTLIGAGIRSETQQAAIDTNFFTKSNWNHAALIVREGEQLKVAEALAGGITVRELDFYTRPRSDMLDAALLRYRYTLADWQKQKINRYALGKVGAKYDFLGIVGFLLKIVLGLRFNPLASDEKLFCSEFIARAFGKAHIQLTPNAPQLTSPEDLYQSTALKRVV